MSSNDAYDQAALDAASREVHMMLLREGSSWGTKACEEMGRVFMTAYRKALPSEMAPQQHISLDRALNPHHYPPLKDAAPKEKHGEGETPRTDEVWEGCLILEPDNAADRLYDHARQLERELADARELANRETMSAAYWKAKAEALSSVVPIAWIAYRAGEVPVHFSKADGWSVEVVAEGKAQSATQRSGYPNPENFPLCERGHPNNPDNRKCWMPGCDSTTIRALDGTARGKGE